MALVGYSRRCGKVDGRHAKASTEREGGGGGEGGKEGERGGRERGKERGR